MLRQLNLLPGLFNAVKDGQEATTTATRLWNTARSLVERMVGGSVVATPLPVDEVKQLCDTAKDILGSEKNILNVESPVTIVGDIHGQYLDLLQIFESIGCVPDTNYVFLGDYVDRGDHSVETLQLLLALKMRYPLRVTLLRGNHECRSVAQVFGFYDEVLLKYGSADVWNYYADIFEYLPLGCIIDARIFCTHGGLSPYLDVVDDLDGIDRFQEVPHDGAFCDLLWSDPSDDPGWSTSSRGAGFLFGPDITEQFLHASGLEVLCRAHQLVLDGYEWMHNKQLVTIFSAPNYCGRVGNQGAVMTIDSQQQFSFRQFDGCDYQSARSLEKKLLDEVLWDSSGLPGGRSPRGPRQGEQMAKIISLGDQPTRIQSL